MAESQENILGPVRANAPMTPTFLAPFKGERVRVRGSRRARVGSGSDEVETPPHPALSPTYVGARENFD